MCCATVIGRRNLLKRQGAAVTAGFPEGAAPDTILQRAAAYIEELIPSLRKAIAKAEAPPKKKGPAATVRRRAVTALIDERISSRPQAMLPCEHVRRVRHHA